MRANDDAVAAARVSLTDALAPARDRVRDMSETTYLVPLSRGLYATIDGEDAEVVLPFKWTAQRAKQTYYAYRCDRSGDKPKKVYLHRVVLAQPDVMVDHKDRDGLNCRRQNLRPATPAQNRANALRGNRFGGTGVRREGRRWSAYISDGTVRRRLGGFATADEAAESYRTAARDRYGDFAP